MLQCHGERRLPSTAWRITSRKRRGLSQACALFAQGAELLCQEAVGIAHRKHATAGRVPGGRQARHDPRRGDLGRARCGLRLGLARLARCLAQERKDRNKHRFLACFHVSRDLSFQGRIRLQVEQNRKVRQNPIYPRAELSEMLCGQLDIRVAPGRVAFCVGPVDFETWGKPRRLKLLDQPGDVYLLRGAPTRVRRNLSRRRFHLRPARALQERDPVAVHGAHAARREEVVLALRFPEVFFHLGCDLAGESSHHSSAGRLLNRAALRALHLAGLRAVVGARRLQLEAEGDRCASARPRRQLLEVLGAQAQAGQAIHLRRHGRVRQALRKDVLVLIPMVDLRRQLRGALGVQDEADALQSRPQLAFEGRNGKGVRHDGGREPRVR
mmetsp:Transcript_61133/g.186607  ORF Transcript_61133/g.186607 Transcript_61133/m.186607 type:complete len:384 (+) Transcript_61133:772-1923(+)